MHAFGAIPVAVSKAPTSLSTSSSSVSSAGATYTSSERHSDSQDKRRTPSPSRSAQANSRAKSHFHSSPLRPQEDSMAYTTPVMTTPSTSSKREKLEVKTKAEPISRQSSSSSKKSSGSGSAPSTPRTKHEYPGDVLWDVLGESVKPRRSRCTPEFLEEIAKHRGSSIVTNGGDSGVSLQNPELAGTTKLIAGVEAVDIYRKFVAGTSIHDILTTLPLPSLKKALGSAKEEPKVVFGVAAVTSSHKHVVEYFRTWKGHDSTLSKEESRNLDIAFKRVRRALDAEFKRASIYGNFTPPSPTHSNPSLGASPGPKRPTTLDVPAHDANVDPPTKSLPRPPLSATDSVMSLPFLNMIRGVPLGNRVPLRVTNPDRLSMVSGTSSLPSPPITPETPTFTQHVSAKEASENAENIAPQPLQSRYPPRYASTIDTATLTRQGTHSTKRDPEDYNLEFIVVLLEEKIEKSGRTWHGLERQTSARPSHALSRRVSPWDGPLVRDSGITYSTAPRPRPLANVSEPNHSPSSKAKSFKRNHSTPLSGHHLALPLLHSKSGSASSSRSNLNKSKHHHHHHGTAPTADESSSDESDDEPEVLGWQKPVVPSTAFMLAATAAIAAGSSSSMSSGTTDSSYGNTPASGMGVPLPSMHGMSMSAHAMSPPPGVAPVIPPGYGTVAVARNPSVASHYSHMHATNGMPLSRSASVGYATPYTQPMMMTPAMGAHMMMVPSKAASTASGYHRHPGY